MHGLQHLQHRLHAHRLRSQACPVGECAAIVPELQAAASAAAHADACTTPCVVCYNMYADTAMSKIF